MHVHADRDGARRLHYSRADAAFSEAVVRRGARSCRAQMKRHVRTLICVIAVALVVFGGMETGLEFARHRVALSRGNPPPAWSVWQLVIGGVLILLGLFLFAASRSLAEQLTDDFEE